MERTCSQDSTNMLLPSHTWQCYRAQFHTLFPSAHSLNDIVWSGLSWRKGRGLLCSCIQNKQTNITRAYMWIWVTSVSSYGKYLAFRLWHLLLKQSRPKVMGQHVRLRSSTLPSGGHKKQLFRNISKLKIQNPNHEKGHLNTEEHALGMHYS